MAIIPDRGTNKNAYHARSGRSAARLRLVSSRRIAAFHQETSLEGYVPALNGYPRINILVSSPHLYLTAHLRRDSSKDYFKRTYYL